MNAGSALHSTIMSSEPPNYPAEPIGRPFVVGELVARVPTFQWERARNSTCGCLVLQLRPATAKEYTMTSILRGLRVLVAVVLASAVGSLPACGTMGGGGGMMHLNEHLQIQGFTSA